MRSSIYGVLSYGMSENTEVMFSLPLWITLTPHIGTRYQPGFLQGLLHEKDAFALDVLFRMDFMYMGIMLEQNKDNDSYGPWNPVHGSFDGGLGFTYTVPVWEGYLSLGTKHMVESVRYYPERAKGANKDSTILSTDSGVKTSDSHHVARTHDPFSIYAAPDPKSSTYTLTDHAIFVALDYPLTKNLAVSSYVFLDVYLSDLSSSLDADEDWGIADRREFSRARKSLLSALTFSTVKSIYHKENTDEGSAFESGRFFVSGVFQFGAMMLEFGVISYYGVGPMLVLPYFSAAYTFDS